MRFFVQGQHIGFRHFFFLRGGSNWFWNFVGFESFFARILRRLHPGAVILLHDRCAGSERLVGLLVEGLRSRGLEPVTLPELFDIEAYEKTR